MLDSAVAPSWRSLTLVAEDLSLVVELGPLNSFHLYIQIPGSLQHRTGLSTTLHAFQQASSKLGRLSLLLFLQELLTCRDPGTS